MTKAKVFVVEACDMTGNPACEFTKQVMGVYATHDLAILSLVDGVDGATIKDIIRSSDGRYWIRAGLADPGRDPELEFFIHEMEVKG